MTTNKTQPAPLDDAGAMAVLAADAAIARALRDVKQLPGERDDFWLARVRAHAAERLATNASAGFAWNGHMVHGDKASIEAVMAMVRAEAELASANTTVTELREELASLRVYVAANVERASRAEAELAAVREDGARLDYIERSGADVFRTMSSNEWAVGPDCETRKFAPTLRAAIDAARGAG